MFLSDAHIQHTQVNTWGEKIRTASEIQKTRMPVGSIPEKEKGISVRRNVNKNLVKPTIFGWEAMIPSVSLGDKEYKEGEKERKVHTPQVSPYGERDARGVVNIFFYFFK